MEYLCETRAGTLIPGMPTDGTFRHSADDQDLGHTSKIGAFAEHTVVSAGSLVKIDEQLPLVPAALLACAVPTGYGSAVHRANVRGGDAVVVIGAGGIGTAAVQGARISGASEIVAVDPVASKQESALRFGATHSVANVSRAVELVRDLTRGVMADGVVVSPSEISDADVGGRAGPHPQGWNLRAHRDGLAGNPFGRIRPAGLRVDEQKPVRHRLRVL